jgi:hypothetical protein
LTRTDREYSNFSEYCFRGLGTDRVNL